MTHREIIQQQQDIKLTQQIQKIVDDYVIDLMVKITIIIVGVYIATSIMVVTLLK